MKVTRLTERGNWAKSESWAIPGPFLEARPPAPFLLPFTRPIPLPGSVAPRGIFPKEDLLVDAQSSADMDHGEDNNNVGTILCGSSLKQPTKE